MEQDSSGSLADACRLWSLRDATEIADTATSKVFRVTRADGSLAALKLLKPYGADEIVGVHAMQYWAGHGAARILAVDGLMILMEWLDGEPLGNLVREHHRDAEATAILCDVAAALHAPRGAYPNGLEPLPRRFTPLFESSPADWSPADRPHAARAARLADDLIASTTTVLPLHGDFHHDNVVGSARGWLAIDAKGVLGDPHYEAANVFRNPYGIDGAARDPARIDALADAFTARLGLNRRRLLQWAAAHCALSECWNRQSGTISDFNPKLLPVLLEAAERSA